MITKALYCRISGLVPSGSGAPAGSWVVYAALCLHVPMSLEVLNRAPLICVRALEGFLYGAAISYKARGFRGQGYWRFMVAHGQLQAGLQIG